MSLEIILILTGIGFYFFTLFFSLSGAIFRKDKFTKSSQFIFASGYIFHTASMIIRWINTGHPPVMGGYENALLGSWFVGCIYLLFSFKYREIKLLNIITSAVILFMLGTGLNSSLEHQPLSPPYRSYWLWIHVGFAWLAWGSFVASAGLGMLYLLKDSRTYSWLVEMPSIEKIDEFIAKFILFGFVSQGFVLASGAVWASNLWGSYWSWDPVETWSLICWLLYGLIIHLRFTMGWKGRKLALLSIIAIVTAIIYFWGIGFVTSIHTRMIR